MEKYIPSYLQMNPDELRERIDKLNALTSPCTLCPRQCQADRRNGETGYCHTNYLPVVSSIHPHHGEEGPLSGTRGSGTIFFTNCNLGCSFCQNYDISHQRSGQTITVKELASAMLSLQESGCHNINFVTPSHQIHAIVEAVSLASRTGLCLPLVYNTGGYDSVETLRLLEGIFDIYMPDLKFTDPVTSASLADAADYPEVVTDAIIEMHRQIGDLVMDKERIACRGLLVRHLVLPGGLSGSEKALRFIAGKISKNTYLNVMDQYHPCYNAIGQPVVGERLLRSEYLEVLELARKCGLKRLD